MRISGVNVSVRENAQSGLGFLGAQIPRLDCMKLGVEPSIEAQVGR